MHYPATFLPVLVDSIFCGNLSPLHPKLKKYWLKCYCFVIESCKCTRPEFLKRKAIFSVLVLSEITLSWMKVWGNTQSFSWSCKACFHHHGEPQHFLIKSSCRFLEISIVCLGCTMRLDMPVMQMRVRTFGWLNFVATSWAKYTSSQRWLWV